MLVIYSTEPYKFYIFANFSSVLDDIRFSDFKGIKHIKPWELLSL